MRTPHQDGWTGLVESLAELESGTPEIGERLASLLPTQPAQRTLDDWRENLAIVLPPALSRRAPRQHEDDTVARELGANRARAGVAVDDLVRAALVQQQVLGELARVAVPASRQRDRLLLEFLSLVQHWTTWFVVGLSAGHDQARDDAPPAKDTFVRHLLLGSISETDTGPYGLDPGAEYHALRARLRPGVEVATVARHLGLDAASGPRTGLLTVVDGDIWGLTTVRPSPEPPVSIGISAAGPINALPAAFRQASRALDAAVALRRREVVSLDDIGVLAAITADRELGQLLAQRYLGPVSEGAGPPILAAVERYIENANQLELTARELNVHANTIRYRLGRYEELTGCSLRDIRVLAEIWWALSWRRLENAA